METSCPLYEIGKVIHPFAYRVHTHELGKCYTTCAWYCWKYKFICPYITTIIVGFLLLIGKVVAGYRVKNINKEVQKWDLLGKRDPMTPQMFYPIENNITVESGDILVSSFRVSISYLCILLFYMPNRQAASNCSDLIIQFPNILQTFMHNH